MDTPTVEVTNVRTSEEHVLINGIKAKRISDYRRHTYKTRKFIVKIDTIALEAKREVKLWKRLDEEDRKHFVPILCSSLVGRWICQERLDIIFANQIEYEERNELWDAIIEPICEKYNLADLSPDWNWGMVDGVPMIYDYGQ